MTKYTNFIRKDISVYNKTQNSLYSSKKGRLKKIITSIVVIIGCFVFIQLLIFFAYLIFQNLEIVPREEGSLIIGTGEVIVAIIATIAVAYQLGQVKENDKKLREIEEAKFILEFNQSFIQDNKICKIEELLEKRIRGKIDITIINSGNRQSLINYLVYLEGLATLVNRNVLTIESIDDLFAYRFFLAMNNEEVQRDQLFKYPDYYRGCFKLYALWKGYRKEQKLSILQNETSIDKWIHFEEYINCSITIRECQKKDSCKRIAEIIYNVDKYIYPTAFESVTKARKILPKLINEENGLFSRKNIRLAIYQDKIVGVSIVLASDKIDVIKPDFIKKYSSTLPNFADVCERYFNMLAQKEYTNTPYLLCLCIDKKYHNKGIGSILLKNLISEYKDKNITLHVLKNYDPKNKTKPNPAIHLYTKYGFKCHKEVKGYALTADKTPECIEMIRIQQEKHLL